MRASRHDSLTDRRDHQQAANLVSTNDKQIRRAIYAREIPVARLGKSYSIAVADLIQWFDRRKSFL
jgi:hypothetical protein